MKLFLVVNVEWSFLSHRLPIALSALQKGYDVTVFAVEEEGKGDEIRSHGIRFIPLPTTRGGRNPLTELNLIRFLYKYYKSERPDIIHHVAIKPVLLGSLAARLANQPKVVNAIAGFGSMFIGEGVKTRLYRQVIQRLFRFAFQSSSIIMIVQNEDDYQEVKKIGVPSAQIRLIRGSGVDLKDFAYTKEPETPPLRVVLPARVLWDKGVREYVDAARILKQKHGDNALFLIAGKIDQENITGVSQKTLDEWNEEGVIKWIGHQENVPAMFRESHVVVLPSYREGLPKALVEAAAIGRPIVTTDVPGCREVVENGLNGYLVPVKSADQLAEAIDKILRAPKLREQMGLAGRQKQNKSFPYVWY